MPEYDAVISYAPNNRDIVTLIAKRLRDAGLRVWFDMWDLLPGRSWVESTLRALEETRVVLLLIGEKDYTPEERSWVSYESSVAAHYHLRSRRDMITLPVLLPGASPSNMPPEVAGLAYLALENSSDESLTRLVSLLCMRVAPLVRVDSRPKIFLCHSKQDDERVSQLFYGLRDEGFDPWYDKEKLDIGDRWEDEILAAIENTDFFAMCLSEKAVGKEGFLQKEIRTAIRAFQSRAFDLAFLLPIRLEECEVPNIRIDENTTLRSVQWADLFLNDERAFERFVAGIWKQWERKNAKKA